MGKKTCKDCNTPKPLREFGVDRHYKDGYKNLCKKCAVIRTAIWRRDNPEKQKIVTQRVSASRKTTEYRAKANAASRERYANDPDYKARRLANKRRWTSKQELG